MGHGYAIYEILCTVCYDKEKQTNQKKKKQDFLLAGKWEQKEKYFRQY